MEFWQYYRVLRRRRWVFLLVALATLATVLYTYQPLPAGYAATASIKTDSTAALVSVLNSHTVLMEAAALLHVPPQALERRVVVREDRDAGVVRVMALGTTPEGAERAATALVQAGIQVYDRLIREGASRQRAFIQGQLDQAQARLREAQARLADFRTRSGASLSPSVAAALDRTMALEAARDSAIAERADVQARLAATDSLLSGTQRTRTERVVQENPAAQKIQSELIGLQIALNEELAVHTEQHPNVIALRIRIARLEQMLASELHKVLTSETIGTNPVYEKLLGNRIDLLVQLASANARIEGATAALRGMRGQLPALSRNEAELARLTQEAAGAERVVTALQDRLLDAQLKEQEVLSTGGPHLLDPATASGAAIPSERTSRLLIALLLGGALGIAAAFFVDYVDATIRTTKDAERVLGIPAAGTIPAHNPPVADAYAALRTNLVNETPGMRTLLVTGIRPRSGTSTVARNLAAAYARAGTRTVLVDANFRHPSTASGEGPGTLSQVLAGGGTVTEALREGEVPGLWILPCGPAPHDPSGYLHAHMPRVLDALKAHAEMVIVDTPAAAPFPDALAIAPHVDGTILVVAAGQAIGSDGVRVRDQLVRARARLLGIVVNRVSSPDDETYALYARYMGRSPAAAQVAGGVLALLLVLSAGMAVGWYLDAPWWHWAQALITSHAATVTSI